MTQKILVVAAHPDDELLGVGGTLLKHRASGDQIIIAILGDGEKSRTHNVDVAKRSAQATKVSKLLRAEKLWLGDFLDNQFDAMPLLTIIKKIEEIVYIAKPTIIYTHHAFDLNIDHRLTFQAVMTACRPIPGSTVQKILSFETLSSTEWQAPATGNMFMPTEFVDISTTIEEKIKLLKLYVDELRAFPHPRSVEGIRTLAAYRGMTAGLKAAEAFQVIRSIYV